MTLAEACLGRREHRHACLAGREVALASGHTPKPGRHTRCLQRMMPELPDLRELCQPDCAWFKAQFGERMARFQHRPAARHAPRQPTHSTRVWVRGDTVKVGLAVTEREKT